MTQEFKVINPLDGSYTGAVTEQERNQLLAEIAWKFFLAHTHDAPYSVVVTNEDGSESWTSPNGSPQLSPAELEAQAAAWASLQAQT